MARTRKLSRAEGVSCARQIDVRSLVIVGGVDMIQQQIALAKGPHIIVATPGRIVDHLQNTKGFHLRKLRALVMDEADKLLNMDFEKEINLLLSVIPKERSTYLFSATMTSKVQKLQRASLTNPVKVEVSSKNQIVSTLQQVREGSSISSLAWLLISGRHVCNGRLEVARVARSGQIERPSGGWGGAVVPLLSDEVQGRLPHLHHQRAGRQHGHHLRLHLQRVLEARAAAAQPRLRGDAAARPDVAVQAPRLPQLLQVEQTQPPHRHRRRLARAGHPLGVWRAGLLAGEGLGGGGEFIASRYLCGWSRATYPL